MKLLKLGVLLLALAVSGFGQTTKVEPVANPSNTVSLQAHWGVAQNGIPLLSSIETPKDGSSVLRYAVRSGAQWTPPRTIVTNRHFFRQPAESPSVVSFPYGSLLAEWVGLPPGSGEAEYVYVSASKDGIRWTPPVVAHQDRSPVQHALVSMIASRDKEASLIWLEAPKGEDAASVLKPTVVNSDGKVVREESLDTEVCTCCPTSIVKTAKGLLVAYRDHAPQDIRDIGVIRFENGRWLPSKILNPDKWEINAYPVNGAAAAAKDNRVAIGWYTEGQDDPRTQLVFSTDGGATFGKAVRISTGNSFGHVSVDLDEQGGAFVSWLEEGKGEGVRLLVRQVTAAGVAGATTEVAQGSRSTIGYPRLLHASSETWIAWGNSGPGKKQTARLTK